MAGKKKNYGPEDWGMTQVVECLPSKCLGSEFKPWNCQENFLWSCIWKRCIKEDS